MRSGTNDDVLAQNSEIKNINNIYTYLSNSYVRTPTTKIKWDGKSLLLPKQVYKVSHNLSNLHDLIYKEDLLIYFKGIKFCFLLPDSIDKPYDVNNKNLRVINYFKYLNRRQFTESIDTNIGSQTSVVSEPMSKVSEFKKPNSKLISKTKLKNRF